MEEITETIADLSKDELIKIVVKRINEIFKHADQLKAKDKEIDRLQRHIDMQDLTISKMKNELNGIPEITSYSDTAELKEEDK